MKLRNELGKERKEENEKDEELTKEYKNDN
jgi:hypothetical protein